MRNFLIQASCPQIYYYANYSYYHNQLSCNKRGALDALLVETVFSINSLV